MVSTNRRTESTHRPLNVALMPPSRTSSLVSDLRRVKYNRPKPYDTATSKRPANSREGRHTTRHSHTTFPNTPHSSQPAPVAHVDRTNPTHAENIKRVLESSLAKRTTANYASATRAFIKFCGDNGFHPIPASEFTLCAFAASMASSLAGSSIANMFAGLKSWHNMHNAAWNGSPRLQLIIRGAHSLSPTSSSKPQRPPVTIQMLEELDRWLSRSDPADIATRAAAMVLFWGQCRSGEVLGSSKTRHDASRYPSRSSLGPPISSNGSRELHLPTTKTHQARGESILITAQRNPIDPIKALNAHLNSSKHIPDTAHIFAYKDRGSGVIHCLTKEKFLSRCNEIWRRSGRERVTGHAFRIGGTTGLLKAGVPPEVVRSMGRWSSDAHFRYWRDTRDIALSHAERLPRPGQEPRRPIAHATHASTSRALRAKPRLQGDRSHGSLRPN